MTTQTNATRRDEITDQVLARIDIIIPTDETLAFVDSSDPPTIVHFTFNMTAHQAKRLRSHAQREAGYWAVDPTANEDESEVAHFWEWLGDESVCGRFDQPGYALHPEIVGVDNPAACELCVAIVGMP